MQSLVTTLLRLGIPVAAVGFLVAFAVAHRTGRLPPRFWTLFLIGCALGCTWEVGFGLLGPDRTETPLFVWIHPGGVPLDPQPADGGGLGRIIGLVAVCVWDGALFVAGLMIVRRLRPAPTFVRFDLAELGILLAWGQLQSFAVEMIALAGGLWGYLPQWYNPALFPFLDGHITTAPQAVWLLAYPVFYAAALRLTPPAAAAASAR